MADGTSRVIPFAAWLEHAMRRNGLFSNRDLSRAAGVSDSVISRWRTAGVTPTVGQLRLLSGPLGTDLLDLLVLAGVMTAEERRQGTGPVPPGPPVPADAQFRRSLAAAHLDADLERVVMTAWRSAQRLQALRHRPSSARGTA